MNLTYLIYRTSDRIPIRKQDTILEQNVLNEAFDIFEYCLSTNFTLGHCQTIESLNT